MDSRQVVKLTDAYEIASGLSKPRKDFGFGHQFLTFKDVLDNYVVPQTLGSLVNSNHEERHKCSILRGDVFLTRTSETYEDLGMSCVALKDYPLATFNGFTKRLRPKPGVCIVPEYAAYYFRGPRFRRAVTAMSSLSTRASLNNEMLGRLEIELPPLHIQSAIGGILRSLDDKIELNRRMNETLEAMARSLFTSWFERQPENDVGIGDLEVRGILAVNDGYRAKNSELGAPGLPFIRAGNLNGGGFDLAGSDLLAEARIALAGVKLSQPGDVAFTSKGTVGRFAFVHKTTPKFVYSPQLCFWRSMKPDQLDPHVLFQWMKSDELADQIDAVKGQTDMADYVSLRDQRRMKFTVQLGAVQVELGRRLEPLMDRVAANLQQSRTLVTLRDSLLPKLLSGEIRLRNAERKIKEVV